MVHVVVAGQLPREAHNAPLHLFSASPELVGFGGQTYQRHSEKTSRLLGILFGSLQREGFAMSYTMEDFIREDNRERFLRLTPEKRRELIQTLSAEEQCEALEHLPPERLREVLRLL